MSEEVDKQAWLAHLFGGSPPPPISDGTGACGLSRSSSAGEMSPSGGVGANRNPVGLRRSNTFGGQAGPPPNARALPPIEVHEGAATATSLTISWDWKPDEEGADTTSYAYAVHWKGILDTERSSPDVGTPPLEHTIEGLEPNDTYYVWITATAKGSGAGRAVVLESPERRMHTCTRCQPPPFDPPSGDEAALLTLVPPTSAAHRRRRAVPLPPTDLEASQQADGSVRLRWKGPAGSAPQFSVRARTLAGERSVYTGSMMECSVDSQAVRSALAFSVCSMNALGDASEWSAEVPAPAASDTSSAASSGRADASNHASGPGNGPPAASGISLDPPRLVDCDERSITVALDGHVDKATVAALAVEVAPALTASKRPGPWRVVPAQMEADGGALEVRIENLQPNSVHLARVVAFGTTQRTNRLGTSTATRCATTPAAPGPPSLLPERVRPDVLAMKWTMPVRALAPAGSPP